MRTWVSGYSGKFLSFSLLAATTFAAVPAAAEDAKLELGLLNRTLASLIAEVLAAHRAEPNPLFKDLTFRIDERRTDLTSADQFRVAIVARATAAESAWSRGDTSVQLELSGGADRVKRQADLAVRGTIETETLELGRFVAAKLAPDLCDPKRKGTEDPALTALACRELGEMAKAADLGRYFAGIVKLAEWQVAVSAGEIAKLEKDLASATEKQKPGVQRRLDRARREAVVAGVVTAEAKRTLEAGRASGRFRFQLRSLEIPEMGQLTELEVYIDEKQVQLGVQFLATDVKDIDSYFAMRPRLEAELLKLQNGDPAALREAKQTALFLFSIAKGILGK